MLSSADVYGPHIPHFSLKDLDFDNDELKCIKFLQQFNIFPAHIKCPRPECSHDMILQQHLNQNESSLVYRCPLHSIVRPFAKGTFFELKRRSTILTVKTVYTWAHLPSIPTINHWSRKFGNLITSLREICSWKLSQDPVLLGGPDHLVQIRELIVNLRRDPHSDWSEKEAVVLVIYDLNEKRGFLELIPDREPSNIVSVVQRVLIPGTEIYRADWNRLTELQRAERPQLLVCQQRPTGESAEGQSEGIEEYSESLKLQKSTIRNVQTLSLVLAECIWRERFGFTEDLAFVNLLTQIGERHPPDANQSLLLSSIHFYNFNYRDNRHKTNVNSYLNFLIKPIPHVIGILFFLSIFNLTKFYNSFILFCDIIPNLFRKASKAYHP